MTTYHTPALLQETIRGLNICPNGVYVDLTFGGGGHSQAIIQQLGKDGKLLGFDQDIAAYENRIDDSRFIFVHSNFRYVANFLRYHGTGSVDGILADLGVSFHQFDSAERGFSFRFEGEPDMRMNRQAPLSAKQVINTYQEEQLAHLFYQYGELNNGHKLASAIAKARTEKPIETVRELLNILQPFFKFEREKKELAKAFQAIRIEVNNEINVLGEMLLQTPALLKQGGRLAVITYHSLEDRMVKNFIKSGNLEGKIEKDFFGNIHTPLKAVYNKPITPSDEEITKNPRARSAKLRIAEKG